MANYKNIKPYSDFAHEAAQHGGVDSYLEEISDSNFQMGIMAERESEKWKGALLVGATVLIWEGGKAGYLKLKKRYRDNKAKQAELKRRSKTAKKYIIDNITEEKADKCFKIAHYEDSDG